MVGESLLVQAGAMFGVIAVVGAVAWWTGQSVIPFYLVAGVVTSTNVIGDWGFPASPPPEYVTLFAELGIIFLLFFLGLEFSIDRLVAQRGQMARAGLLDLAVNLPVGVGIGLVLGWSLLEAFVLGGIVYISSSAVITKSLVDLGWIANPESEPILGTLVFEDLFVALYLAAISAVLLGGGSLTSFATDVGTALGFLLVLLLAVWLGEAAFERLLATESGELFVIRAVAIVVLIAGLGLSLGLSEAVAAFFVGMGFSTTGHVSGLEARLGPLRDVFAAVFFFWIGLTTNPAIIVAVAGLLALLVVTTTPAKLLSGFLGGRIYGLDDRRSVRVAAGMVTRGEFSLVIAALAATAGSGTVLTETIPALAVGYVVVMSVLGTTGMHQATRLESVLLGPVTRG